VSFIARVTAEEMLVFFFLTFSDLIIPGVFFFSGKTHKLKDQYPAREFNPVSSISSNYTHI